MASATRHHAAGITSPSSGVWSSSIIGCLLWCPNRRVGPGWSGHGTASGGGGELAAWSGFGACRRCPHLALPPALEGLLLLLLGKACAVRQRPDPAAMDGVAVGGAVCSGVARTGLDGPAVTVLSGPNGVEVGRSV